ncbi:MAG: hypothetical protein EOM19_00015 [Candidatus Moranbacteria bacterium]|nr:hypothetical protein [Candidatus Moranbacteria bacterium]
MEEKMKEKEINKSSSLLFSFFEGKKIRFLILLFVGIVAGFVVKWNVSDYVTMGYEDYMIEKNTQVFDYKKMAETLAQKASNSEGEASVGIDSGAACGI